jgi:hypothetical protein
MQQAVGRTTRRGRFRRVYRSEFSWRDRMKFQHFKQGTFVVFLAAVATTGISLAGDVGPDRGTQRTPAKVSSAAGTVGKTEASEITYESAAADWVRTVRSALKDVSETPSNSKEFTSQQQAAVKVLGLYRAASGCDKLLRVISVRAAADVGWETSGELRRRSVLEDYPAATALAAIGMPSVRAILSEINTRKDGFFDIETELYARIIENVLGTTEAVTFLSGQENQATDDKSARELHRILAVLKGANEGNRSDSRMHRPAGVLQ